MGAIVAVAALSGACGEESMWVRAAAPAADVATQGVWVMPPNAEGPATLVPARAPSVGPRPTVNKGRELGYELTSEAPGSYRFRWTSDNLVRHGGVRRFHGSVWTAGHFLSVVPGCQDASCPLETDDYLSAVQSAPGGGERIDWDTLAKDGWDGFSFTVDAQPMYFDVNVDGRPRPEVFQLLTRNRPPAPLEPGMSAEIAPQPEPAADDDE
jgi:hypothetical protein